MTAVDLWFEEARCATVWVVERISFLYKIGVVRGLFFEGGFSEEKRYIECRDLRFIFGV